MSSLPRQGIAWTVSPSVYEAPTVCRPCFGSGRAQLRKVFTYTEDVVPQHLLRVVTFNSIFLNWLIQSQKPNKLPRVGVKKLKNEEGGGGRQPNI